MKSKFAKPIFSIFLLLTFLAGWYFYVMNPKTLFMEYMENMQENLSKEEEKKREKEREEQGKQREEDEKRQREQEEERKREREDVITVKDASRENTNYNTNMYAGFDPTSQYVGVYTNLDQIHESTSYSELSDNPMDANWGGVLYTKQAVESGKYDENVIMPYGHDPERGVGMSTSVHAGIGDMKSVFA